MVCRRCKKEKTEKSGLCLSCREKVLEITRAVSGENYENSQNEGIEEHEIVRLIFHPVYAGYGSLIVLSTFFLLVFLADPEGKILNSMLLASTSLLGFWTLLASGVLIIGLAMYFAVPMPRASKLMPASYYAGTILMKSFPYLFVIVGSVVCISLVYLCFPDADWKPLLALIAGKQIT